MVRKLRKDTVYEAVPFDNGSGYFIHPLETVYAKSKEEADQVAHALNVAKLADKLDRELVLAELTIANLRTLLKGA